MDRAIRTAGPFISIGILLLLVAAAEAFPHAMIALGEEDGPLENLTALLFFIAGLIFLWSARKAKDGQRLEGAYAVFFLVAWGVLMIVFAGEEISWGQRIFGFETPEAIDRANKQNEFNIHNLAFFDSYGGTGNYVSIFMLTVGIVLPVMDRLFPLIRRIGIPVPSLTCCILFAGSYFYGVYFNLMPDRFDAELQFIYFHRHLPHFLVQKLDQSCFLFVQLIA